jgi:hypothetical protein
VRLHRPERVRGDRGADWPSHCSSSNSLTLTPAPRWTALCDHCQTDPKAFGHGHVIWGAAQIVADCLPTPQIRVWRRCCDPELPPEVGVAPAGTGRSAMKVGPSRRPDIENGASGGPSLRVNDATGRLAPLRRECLPIAPKSARWLR